MFRSPMSPASFCTSARSSSRSTISSGESGAAFETFLPGILTANDQSSANIAATAIAMRNALKAIRLNTTRCYLANSQARPPGAPRRMGGSPSDPLPGHAASRPTSSARSRDLFSELQRANNEKQVGHHNENEKIRPVFEEICAAQNDRAHQRDEIRCGEERAEPVENHRHRFPGENESREEHARQQENHRHLERLHLVFGLGSNEQTETQQREYIDQRGEHHREHVSFDWNKKHKPHNREQNQRHRHSDAQIGDKFAKHQTRAAQWAYQ